MDRRSKITEAQRVALRLFLERKTLKEIARELGISAKAVEARLKGARDAFGVASSAEAARLLAAEEGSSAYGKTLGAFTLVAESPTENANEGVTHDANDWRESAGAGHSPVLREAQAEFVHDPASWISSVRWPLRKTGADRNDLSLSARLLWPMVAIFGIGVAIGTLVIGGSLLALAGAAVFRLFK